MQIKRQTHGQKVAAAAAAQPAPFSAFSPLVPPGSWSSPPRLSALFVWSDAGRTPARRACSRCLHMNVLPKYWGVISSLTSTVNGAWVYGFKNRINRHTHKQGSPTAGRPLPLYTTGVQVPCTRGLGELFGRVLLLRVVEQPDWSMVMTLMI